jgi:iron complex transport system substrate-binding protein
MAAVVALLLALLLAACGAAVPANPTATVRQPADSPPTQPLSPPPAAYPRAVVDDEGTTVMLPQRPERIISLTPATTEIVFALGAGDRLVGRGDFDDYPPEAAELPGVAAFTGVNHEALVGLTPDLVLAGGNSFTPPEDIRRIRQLGVPVLVLYAGTVEGVLDDIQLVGRAIDAAPESDALTAAMQQRIDEVTGAVAGLDRPRVFYQIGSEPAIYGPAPDSFVADLVALAGGQPITTTDPAVFEISVERLVEQDPQVIVLGDAQWGVCPADVAARPAWGSMTAVREGAIRPVNDTIVTRPGPRLAEGLAALALAIHPEAAIEPPADALELCPE